MTSAKESLQETSERERPGGITALKLAISLPIEMFQATTTCFPEKWT